MIVERATYKVKAGCADQVVELLKTDRLLGALE